MNGRKYQKPYAILVRTSREFKERERISSKDQLEDAERLAAERGLPISPNHVYVDENFSGKLPPKQWIQPGQKKYRPAFTRLIDAIDRGEVGGVICRKRDRLVRGLELSIKIWNFFKDKDIHLVCTHQTLPESQDGSSKFTYNVLAAADEYELDKITENIRGSKAYCKRHDMKLCGVHSVGYRNGPKSGTIEVNPEGAKIVHEVFNRYIAGETYQMITDHLTEQFPNVREQTGLGDKWHVSIIRKILEAERYIGMRRDESGKLEKSKLFSAIIDPATFHKAQELLKQRCGTMRGIGKTPHLLSGLLRCGRCGSPLRASSLFRYSVGGRHKVGSQYKCPSKHKDSRPFCMMEEEWLEWAISFFAAPFKINKISDSPESLALMIQRDQIQKNIEALKRKVASGNVNVEVFESAIDMATTELENLMRELNALPPALAAPTTPWDKMTFDERRAALQYMIREVDVHRDHAVVKFQQHTQRIDMTFPLMHRRDSKKKSYRARNALTPCPLSNRDAWAVETTGAETVDWTLYVNTGKFYYANARFIVPSGKHAKSKSLLSYRTVDGQVFRTTDGDIANKLLLDRAEHRRSLAECEAMAAQRERSTNRSSAT